MNRIETLENLQADHASDRDCLTDLVEALNERIKEINAIHIDLIREAATKVRGSREALADFVTNNKNMFDKPRTRTTHGIKVGMQKKPGEIQYDDEDSVVKKIKKYYDDELGVLIKTTEKPIKKALQELPVAELKKLGCTLTNTGDQVVVKAMDGDIEKLVDALLKDEPEKVKS